tara:strand:- start:15383 stop:15712 length:330 start_codon:yes stop_codon:yes gene_type:complete
MLFVVSGTSTGAGSAPAYDGNIVGVYRVLADAIAAHNLSEREGRNVTAIPESADTFGQAWTDLGTIEDAGIYPSLDHNQHLLVEALGFEAAVAAGSLTNAPTVALARAE